MKRTIPVKRAGRLWFLPAAVIVLCGAAALGWQVRGADWVMPAVTARIEAATDLRLSADGPVAATLFPTVGLHAAGVRLTPDHGTGAEPLIYSDAADVELSWASLLRGHVRIERVRLLRSRMLAEPLQPPIDLEVAANGQGLQATVSSADAEIHVAGHEEGDTLALDHVSMSVPGLDGLVAEGTGRLSLHDPVRLVLNAGLNAGGAPIGAAAVAATYSSDGLVLERANWRRLDGLDVSLFGHAAASGGVLRFEGGLGASSEKDSRFDAAAEFDGTFGAGGLDVTLGRIDVRTGDSRLTGNAKIHGGEPERVTASMFLDRLDVSTVRQSPLVQLAGDIAAAGLDADTGLHLRIDELMAGGKSIGGGIVIDASSHGGTFDLHELAARALAGAPLRASGRVALGPAPVAVFDPVHIAYGQVEAAGRLRIDVSGPRPLLVGDLATGPLQLDTLFAGPPPLPPEPMTRRALAAAARAPAPPAWSGKAVALSASLPFDADIAFASPRVAWHAIRLDDARASVGVREHELTVTNLSATTFGGKLALTGRVDTASQPRVAAQLQLTGGDLGRILSDAGIPNIGAEGDIAAELAADGTSTAELVNSLAGNVTIAARDGTISGVDLPILSARLKQAQARPADILQLARVAAGGQTPFAALKGHFRVDRGVARTDDVQLAATDGAARVRGSIDLPRRSLNLVSEFEVTDPPGVPPLVVTLDGPLAAPRRVFDISRLQAYLLHRREPAPAR